MTTMSTAPFVAALDTTAVASMGCMLNILRAPAALTEPPRQSRSRRRLPTLSCHPGTQAGQAPRHPPAGRWRRSSRRTASRSSGSTGPWRRSSRGRTQDAPRRGAAGPGSETPSAPPPRSRAPAASPATAGTPARAPGSEPRSRACLDRTPPTAHPRRIPPPRSPPRGRPPSGARWGGACRRGCRPAAPGTARMPPRAGSHLAPQSLRAPCTCSPPPACCA
mmetsp:Transcript_28470/g.73116  ORF Transcript_28470/g.73116 Transcript_28470/m.73116 type:complete len:221 (+) Transcript_28470:247-909(+)